MKQQKKTLDPRAKAGVLAELARNARLVWRLLRDHRVAPWVKAIIPATVVYVLSPLDLVPDAFLGLGQLDDLAVILLGVKFFLDLCPPEIIKEHLADIVSLSVPYRVVDEDQRNNAGANQQVNYLEGRYRVMDDAETKLSKRADLGGKPE